MSASRTVNAPRTASRITAAGIAGVMSVAGCAAPEGSREPDPGTTTGTATDPTASGESSTERRYTDGDYTATGWYGGQPSHIIVDVTLRDDRVVAVEVTPTATNETSLDLQEQFAAAVADEVVGRPIDEIELDYLAGSSGTTQGFNDALDAIRQDAAR